MLLKDLQTLGFSKNLSTVYLALFELGESRAGDLIRKTGLHRNLVYTALDRLEEKKLVTKSQVRGVARYSALDPTRIMGEVEEKQRLAESIIEELKAQHEVTSQEVVIYEGKEEMQRKMRQVYERMKPGEEMNILGGTSSYWFQVMGENNINAFLEIQKKQKFYLNLVGGQMDENEHRLKQELGDLINYKVLPNISSKTNENVILKDRVIMLIFVEPFTAVEIINPAVVASYKEFFDLLWEEDVVVEKGFDALEKFIYEMLDELGPGDEYFVLGASVGMESDAGQVLYDTFHKERIKKGVITNMIVYQESYDLIKKRFEKSGDPRFEISNLKKFTSAPPIPMQINLYNNKARFILYGEEPTIVYFGQKEVFDSFKNYFDYLWNQEVTTYTGWEEVNHLFNHIVLDSLEDDDVEYVIGGGYGEDTTSEQVAALFREHNSYLVKHKIRKRMLLYEQFRDKFKQDVIAAGDTDLHYIKTRYVADTYRTPVEIHVFKNQALVTYFGEKPFSTRYTHPKIIESYKRQFDMLWKIAKL